MSQGQVWLFASFAPNQVVGGRRQRRFGRGVSLHLGAWLHASLESWDLSRLLRSWPLITSHVAENVAFFLVLLMLIYPGSFCVCCWKWFVLKLLEMSHVWVFLNHVKLWLSVVVEINLFIFIDILLILIHLRVWLGAVEHRLQSFVWIWLVIASILILHVIVTSVGGLVKLSITWLSEIELLRSGLLRVIELLWAEIIDILILVEPLYGSWLMLFSHHFNGLLSTVKIEPIVLFFLLNLHAVR